MHSKATLNTGSWWRLLVMPLMFHGSIQADISLPVPGGSNPVGTATYFLERETEHGARQLTVQAWYPSENRSPGASFAPYLPDWEVSNALREQEYYGQPAELIGQWRSLETRSAMGVAPATSEKLPVVLFSPGLGVIRANYTTFAQELASRGFAVLLVEPPDSGFVRNSNGSLGKSEDEDFTDDSEPDWVQVEATWADDLIEAAAWLTDRRLPLNGVLDLDRLAVMGHSLGGAAAFEACRIDQRFRACINLDGLSHGTAQASGVGRPALFVKSEPRYSDEDLATRGRTRESWEQMVAKMRPVVQGAIANSTAPGYFVEILGTGHMSFSDAPWVMPETITQFGGNLLTAERSHQIVTGVLLAFLQETLFNVPNALDQTVRHLPEVQMVLGKSSTQ
jgi:dienelactone hydrolase